jgi:hypothetical protein
LITNKGRNILAKYLIGQAPAYASFIALGVGPKPLQTTDLQQDYSEETELVFEVLRVPISSRGYVYDQDGNANIVLAAELPSEQRYEFTEIGVYSAKSNPVAGAQGSRMIYTFSESENWEYHNELNAIRVPIEVGPLYKENSENIIADVVDSSGVPILAFRATSNNALFVGSPNRIDRHERPRFLDKTLFLRGDISKIDVVDGIVSLNEESPSSLRHIHYTGTLATPDLTRNSSADELRLAFSVVNKADNQVTSISSIRMIVEFADTDSVASNNFARLILDLDASSVDFESNRYFVVSQKLQDLEKSAGFSWNNVNLVKIYASVHEDAETPGDPAVLSSNYYIALDGLRFENKTAESPLYGLSGYSVLRNESGLPIAKESNSSNLVEFRFGLDVQ